MEAQTHIPGTPRDLTKWRRELSILEAQCAAADARIRENELYLANMRENQVNRLAELRLQRMLLSRAERAVTTPNPEPGTSPA